MPKRVAKKIHTAYHQGRKQVARAVYSLPGLERHNPRLKLVKFKDHCRAVKSFPAANELAGQDWYLSVQPAATVQRQPPICLTAEEAAKFREETQRLQDGEQASLPEVFLAGLHQARLVSNDFVVLTSANDILVESALNQAVLEENGILDAIWHPFSRSMSGAYCLLASPWSGKNYYHWLMDALPRLSVIEQFDELKNIRLLVPHKLKTFHRDTLQLAGIAPDRLVGFDGGYSQFETLFYPELLSPAGNPSARAVAWLRNRFLGRETISAGRLLYVTRRDAPERRILNEDAVIRCLQARGFETVCPGDLSFAQQVELFSQASVVVGAHGAGLTNMVFAPANATLIELFGDNYVNGCFWAVSNLRGHKHGFMTGPATGLDYTIAPERLNALLDRVSGKS